MGSYKWGHKSPNLGYIVTLIKTPLITTHEPASRGLKNYQYLCFLFLGGSLLWV